MHKITQATPQANFALLLRFDTGEQRLFDARPYLASGVFAALKDPALFNQVRVVWGTVQWPGNIDLCPDMLFDKSVAVQAEAA